MVYILTVALLTILLYKLVRLGQMNVVIVIKILSNIFSQLAMVIGMLDNELHLADLQLYH